MKTALLLGNSYLTIFKFRKELIQRLVFEGYQVYVSFPNGPFGEGQTAEKSFGVNFIETTINRHGKNPFQDLQLLRSYMNLIKKIKPNFILSFTVKPNVYGGIAAAKLHVPFFANITGLGSGLVEGGFVGFVTKQLYKYGLRMAKCVFFQNENDISFFKSHKLLKTNYKLLPGSGVNLDDFKLTPFISDFPRRFLYIGRVMEAKGIDVFLEAAKACKDEKTEFHICGYCEENYRDTLIKLQQQNIIVYHGLVDDVHKYLQEAHCIVLPSHHPEGISNVLLEAAATGRPVITTNHPGCREVVDNGENGFVIPIKDVKECIKAIDKIKSMSLSELEDMGVKGRKKMELGFDRKLVVQSYFDAFKEI